MIETCDRKGTHGYTVVHDLTICKKANASSRAGKPAEAWFSFLEGQLSDGSKFRAGLRRRHQKVRNLKRDALRHTGFNCLVNSASRSAGLLVSSKLKKRGS